jgi:hypothetical protein
MLFFALMPSLRDIFGVTLLVYISYIIGLIIYRMKFAPLAGFPGPKLAAITGWYEFYYDWWLGGKYIFRIEKLHKRYGTIISL